MAEEKKIKLTSEQRDQLASLLDEVASGARALAIIDTMDTASCSLQVERYTDSADDEPAIITLDTKIARDAILSQMDKLTTEAAALGVELDAS